MRTRNNEYNIVKTISIVEATVKLDVKIRLNDDCSNGHCDFAMTATGYEKNHKTGRWREAFCGCCHDEILKYRPGLKIFADLHLSQSNGIPMYGIGNGSFFIEKMLGIDQFEPDEKDYKKTVIEHLRINEAQLNEMLEPFIALYNIDELKKVKESIKALQSKSYDCSRAASSLSKVNEGDSMKYKELAQNTEVKIKDIKAYLSGVRNELKAFVSDYCTNNLFAQWKKEADTAIKLLNSL